MPLASILVVEDNADDWFFLERAFRKTTNRPEVLWSRDGAEALAALTGLNCEHRLPALVLTDIKMPVMDGFALLEGIKANTAFRSISVGVMSASNRQPDVCRAYQLGAEFYIVKPSEFADLLVIAQVIIDAVHTSVFNLKHVRQYIPRTEFEPDVCGSQYTSVSKAF